MAEERIRVLVDRSRDSGWSGALVEMEPDNIYQITDNKGYLSWSALKNYDVLAICGYSTLGYRDEELKLINRFVETGGGLLLASSTSRFIRYAEKPVPTMPMNDIAHLFGAEFLPLEACKGKTELDDDLLKGYPRKDLCLIDCGFLAKLELDDIPISNCGIMDIPENSGIFLQHRETKETVGMCLESGKGRAILINDVSFSQDSKITCKTFIDWLAYNRLSKAEGAENIPDEIPVDEHVKEEGRIKFYYNDFVSEDRVDTSMKFAQKMAEDFTDAFPNGSDISWKIDLTPSSTYHIRWRRSSIGALMSDSSIAYALGAKMMTIGMLNTDQNLFDIIRCTAFEHDVLEKCFGMMAMKKLGFQSEAEEIYDKIVKQFRDKDPTGKEFDIAKAYEYHPKSVWVLNTLIEKYGQNVLMNLAKAVSEGKEPWDIAPHYLFSGMDIFIYYLSLVLEENMYPWFQEIGTTVHPLPLHPSDSDEFKQGVPQYLKSVLEDGNACASDRNDAIKALIEVFGKEKTPLKDSEAQLGSQDKYERLTAAIRMSLIADSRSLQILNDMMYDTEDTALAAISALELVRRGMVSAADRLFQTAREQDYRFQLDAGYALRRIGYKKAEELCFQGLKDENGNPVVEMYVEYDDYLKLFPTVEGCKVANVFSDFKDVSTVRHFPGNTHVTGMYVVWVYTSSEYRRKGLARWAMQETMAHKRARGCSCAYLDTGTRNIAHAMYRSFGFVDMDVAESFTAELKEEQAKVVDGLMIRSYSPGDEIQMAALANECYSNLMDMGRTKAVRPRLVNTYIKLAKKDDKIVGYAQVFEGWRKEEVYLSEICLKKTDDRSEVGAALLSALHNDMVSHGFKKILVNRGKLTEQRFLRELLCDFGYSSRRSGGVGMFKIINLPMLLDDLSPLLTKRLMNSDYKDWRGKISITGDLHKASLSIRNGEISVSAEPESDADIMLSTNDNMLTQIIIGRRTPFEVYLQNEMTIYPMVNKYMTKLLETIFPRIPDGA